MRHVAQAIESMLMDRELLPHTVDNIIRDFIVHERRHIAMEERDFFPAAIEALQPEDWAEIAWARSAGEKDPLFDETLEARFEAVRRHILQLEQDAEADRAHCLAG